MGRAFAKAWLDVLFDGGLSPLARVTAVALEHYDSADRGCFPGRDRLAAELGVSVRTVDRALAELVSAGLVRPIRQGRGHTNRYELVVGPSPAECRGADDLPDTADQTPDDLTRMADQSGDESPEMAGQEADESPDTTDQTGDDLPSLSGQTGHDSPRMADQTGHDLTDMATLESTDMASHVGRHLRSEKEPGEQDTPLPPKGAPTAPDARPVPTRPTPDVDGVTYSAGFLTFWAAFPLKKAKREAYRAWQKLRPSVALQARILAAVEEQRTWPEWTKEDGRYIPHPATWLNQARWEDERSGHRAATSSSTRAPEWAAVP